MLKKILLDDFGLSLHKKSERLVIKGSHFWIGREKTANQIELNLGLKQEPIWVEIGFKKNENNFASLAEIERNRELKTETKRFRSSDILAEIPFDQIEQILIASRGVSLTSDVLENVAEKGVYLAFMTPTGEPYGLFLSPFQHETVEVRKIQFQITENDKGIQLAKAIVLGKMKNQANLLKYFGKYIREKDVDRWGKMVKCIEMIETLQVKVNEFILEGTIGSSREKLMGFEGAGSRSYWEAVRLLMEGYIDFQSRIGHGATDIFNVMLNYGYGILYSRVWSAVVLEGLEPFAGFLHVDRSGKPSLVFDLIEEFRQPVVDRALLSMVRLGQKAEIQNGVLTLKSRKIIAEAVLSRLRAEVVFKNLRSSLDDIVRLQVGKLKSCLRNEKLYEPYQFVW
jgi:CRISPR-associated protein Cas1